MDAFCSVNDLSYTGLRMQLLKKGKDCLPVFLFPVVIAQSKKQETQNATVLTSDISGN